MSFIAVLLRVVRYAFLAIAALLGAIGLVIGTIGAPPVFYEHVDVINESEAAQTAWGLVGSFLRVIWWTLTEHPFLAGLLLILVAFVWWLWNDQPVSRMRQDFEDVRRAVRQEREENDE